MTEALVRRESEGAIAIVTLNRPARHNALVPQLLSALLEALDDEVVRNAGVLVLRAAGRSFSTGGDLLGFFRHRDSIAAYAAQLVGLLNEVILAIYRLPVPAVCAVQGQVCGGALGLLLACDRIVMQRDVTVRPWYGVVGFSPDGGWTALLPDIIGARQAAQWLCSDASHDAATCLDLGLAHEVVVADPTAAALAWARKVAALHAGSVRAVRSLLQADAGAVAARLEAERAAFVRQVQTPEALQGIAHYLGRKAP
jgi:2-(1,2-epoxy-1,2-dihydrophenyl)acetyl-CoA isomerase